MLLFQNLGGYNSVLRPRVVGEWVGREEEDADPLAAEMLHPPVPRAKTEVCWSGDSSPAGRLVIGRPSTCMCVQACACEDHLNEREKKKKFKTSRKFTNPLLALENEEVDV